MIGFFILIFLVSAPIMSVTIMSISNISSNAPDFDIDDVIFGSCIIGVLSVFVGAMMLFDVLIQFGFVSESVLFYCNDYLSGECLTDFGHDMALLYSMCYIVVFCVVMYSGLKISNEI